jgi:hypothetical protein
MGAFTAITAFCTTVVTSEVLRGTTTVVEVSVVDVDEEGDSPPQESHSITGAQTSRASTAER